MFLKQRSLCLIIFIQLFFSCDLWMGSSAESDPISVFSYLCNMIEERYAGFSRISSNWESQIASQKILLEENPTERELYYQIITMVDFLDDGHIRLKAPLGEYNTMEMDNHFSLQNILEYLDGYETQSNGHILYGTVKTEFTNSNAAYLFVGGFSADDSSGFSIYEPSDWTTIFTDIVSLYGDYPYLIIDLRDNTGGVMANGQALLRHFNPRGDILGHSYRKIGPGIDDYEVSELSFLTSSKIYFGQVVLLINSGTMSTTDMVSIAFQEATDAMVIGESNRAELVGGSQAMELPNGWVITLGGIAFEILGYNDGDLIPVDIELSNDEQSREAGIDLQLQQAIDWINAQ